MQYVCFYRDRLLHCCIANSGNTLTQQNQLSAGKHSNHKFKMQIICRDCFGTFIVTGIYVFYASQKHTTYARCTHIIIIYFEDLLCDRFNSDHRYGNATRHLSYIMCIFSNHIVQLSIIIIIIICYLFDGIRRLFAVIIVDIYVIFWFSSFIADKYSCTMSEHRL